MTLEKVKTAKKRATKTKQISFKRLFSVPHFVERKTQRTFSNGWFAQLLDRQIELHAQLSPYLLQLILEDLDARNFLTKAQSKSWKNYEPKKFLRRKFMKNKNRLRFELSFPTQLKWVADVLTEFEDKGHIHNQSNYIWDVLIRNELREFIHAKYEDDAVREIKFSLWMGEWETHCTEFNRMRFDCEKIHPIKKEITAQKAA
jgi:hypothetical protein